MDISSSFHDPALCRALLERLSGEIEALGRPVRFMKCAARIRFPFFRAGCVRFCRRVLNIFPGRDAPCA